MTCHINNQFTYSKKIIMEKERTYSIDLLKGIAAFCVVCIHYGPNWLNPLVRCAVPIFFIITGYYFPSMIKTNFWKHIKKLTIMLICSSGLYCMWEFQQQFRDHTLDSWMTQTFNYGHFSYWLFLGEDLFGFHLWYFYAVLFGLIIFYFTSKWKKSKLLYRATPILLFIFYCGNFTNLPHFYFRNFLFMGVPCMMTGRLIRENKDQAIVFLSKEKYLGFYTMVSIAMIYLEANLINYRYHDYGIRDMYVFTIPFILPFFYYALRNPAFGKNTWIANIGRKYSAYIYIFHIIAANILAHFTKNDTSESKALYTPILVFLISLFMAWAFEKLSNTANKILHAKH